MGPIPSTGQAAQNLPPESTAVNLFPDLQKEDLAVKVEEYIATHGNTSDTLRQMGLKLRPEQFARWLFSMYGLLNRTHVNATLVVPTLGLGRVKEEYDTLCQGIIAKKNEIFHLYLNSFKEGTPILPSKESLFGRMGTETAINKKIEELLIDYFDGYPSPEYLIRETDLYAYEGFREYLGHSLGREVAALSLLYMLGEEEFTIVSEEEIAESREVKGQETKPPLIFSGAQMRQHEMALLKLQPFPEGDLTWVRLFQEWGTLNPKIKTFVDKFLGTLALWTMLGKSESYVPSITKKVVFMPSNRGPLQKTFALYAAQRILQRVWGEVLIKNKNKRQSLSESFKNIKTRSPSVENRNPSVERYNKFCTDFETPRASEKIRLRVETQRQLAVSIMLIENAYAVKSEDADAPRLNTLLKIEKRLTYYEDYNLLATHLRSTRARLDRQFAGREALPFPLRFAHSLLISAHLNCFLQSDPTIDRIFEMAPEQRELLFELLTEKQYEWSSPPFKKSSLEELLPRHFKHFSAEQQLFLQIRHAFYAQQWGPKPLSGDPEDPTRPLDLIESIAFIEELESSLNAPIPEALMQQLCTWPLFTKKRVEGIRTALKTIQELVGTMREKFGEKYFLPSKNYTDSIRKALETVRKIGAQEEGTEFQKRLSVSFFENLGDLIQWSLLPAKTARVCLPFLYRLLPTDSPLAKQNEVMAHFHSAFREIAPQTTSLAVWVKTDRLETEKGARALLTVRLMNSLKKPKNVRTIRLELPAHSSEVLEVLFSVCNFFCDGYQPLQEEAEPNPRTMGDWMPKMSDLVVEMARLTFDEKNDTIFFALALAYGLRFAFWNLYKPPLGPFKSSPLELAARGDIYGSDSGFSLVPNDESCEYGSRFAEVAPEKIAKLYEVFKGADLTEPVRLDQWMPLKLPSKPLRASSGGEPEPFLEVSISYHTPRCADAELEYRLLVLSCGKHSLADKFFGPIELIDQTTFSERFHVLVALLKSEVIRATLPPVPLTKSQ